MRFALGSIAVLLLIGPSCGGVPPQGSDDPAGAIAANLTFPAVSHDVNAVKFSIVAAGGTCDDAPIASKTISLEREPLPGSVAGPGSGQHQFADGFFVLAPGGYLACAAPLAEGGTPSLECARAQAPVLVTAKQTSEVVLVSQCQGAPNGGGDIVVSLNDPPRISALTIDPSKFITTCQSAALSVTAADPNNDAITYGWTIVSGPAGGVVSSTGATATFTPHAAGDYVLNVTVTDVHTAATNSSFPIHVSEDATCAVPDAVQAIIDTKCSTCHTTGSSGGLKMDTPANTYTNLVGKPALGVGCTDRVRVVPGDAATSYIISKLRAAPGICGLPMPRNRPALPETEINTIEAWINSLPH